MFYLTPNELEYTASRYGEGLGIKGVGDK